MNNIFENKRGFSLIELLVAIGIIGILASVVFVNLSDTKAKSRDAKKVAELKVLEQATELYFQERHEFPDDLKTLVEEGYYDDSSETYLQISGFYYNTNGKTYCLGVSLEYKESSGTCPSTTPSVNLAFPDKYMIIPGPEIP